MRAFFPASLALLTAAASAQVTVQPRPSPGPAPALGLSNLDCSAGMSAGRATAPDVPAAPIVRLELGGTAAVPMPNVCAEAAPLAVLPEGVRFPLAPVPRGLSDDELRRLPQTLEQLRLDRLRQRFDQFDASPSRFQREWQAAPFVVRPPVAPPVNRP